MRVIAVIPPPPIAQPKASTAVAPRMPPAPAGKNMPPPALGVDTVVPQTETRKADQRRRAETEFAAVQKDESPGRTAPQPANPVKGAINLTV